MSFWVVWLFYVSSEGVGDYHVEVFINFLTGV